MSDWESIMLDIAINDAADRDYERHLAELQEVLEAALLELKPNIDLDGLPKSTGEGDPLYAAVLEMADTVQAKVEAHRAGQRHRGNKSGKLRTEKAAELLEERQKEADPLFYSGEYPSKVAVAKALLRKEIDYRRSPFDKDGYKKDAEIISEAEEERILTSTAKNLARNLIDPTK